MPNDRHEPQHEPIDVDVRPYTPADHAAVERLWVESGWITETTRRALDWALDGADAWVAEVGGQPESVALTMPATVRYGSVDVPGAVVTAVNTGLGTRRLGLASRVTARAVQAAVGRGAQLACLGIFDRGFYDRLGFGTGANELYVTFDAAALRLPIKARPAERLELDDFEALHRARLRRWRRHGAVTLEPAGHTRAEMLMEAESVFGFGYRDADGRITHGLWLESSNRVSGPYRVRIIAYRNREELLELLALLHQMADQVQLVQLLEPPGVQLEAVLDKPFRSREMIDASKKPGVRALAWWQMRIADLPACVAAAHLPGATVRFNLTLTDPIAAYLPAPVGQDDGAWRGVAGDWIITLGEESGATPGRDESLPTLRTSVNTFTRLWLGVAPATALAVSDPIDAPDELLERLDSTVRLPTPRVDWEF